MQGEQRARAVFVTLWAVVLVVKLIIAARLPLFVDEAFYWQEGQHLAAAYSDLPGLTAWMTRAGVELFGAHPLGVRALFLLLGALLPWMVMLIGSRWFGAVAGWQAGSLAAAMPLSATLGILAVPDVPMAFAAVVCLAAGAYLLRGVAAKGVILLALGLVVGALSHYRFLGVIGFGFIALLLMPEGRRVLRDPRVWVALSIGVVAWLPLLAWNADHNDAGLRFQLVDRHPWQFALDGAVFLVIQPLLVTPILFWSMLQVSLHGLRQRTSQRVQWHYFALAGGVSTALVFLLGFFTDIERISFHWPLPGYLALLLVVPVAAHRWPRALRRWGARLVLAGTVLALGYYLMAGSPALRQALADSKFYPRNFASWQVLATAVEQELAAMPDDAALLAGNFKIGAELGFLRGDGDVAVLPHLLNDKHGRSEQLRQWGLLQEAPVARPQLLVLAPSDYRYKDLLAYYHQLCELVGPLPPPRTVSLDHGAQRFLLLRLPAERSAGPCVTPAMAWIDSPLPQQTQDTAVEVRGWAFKDGVGLERVEVLVDGQVAAQAQYGQVQDVTGYWKISTDPQHPRVGFSANVDLRGLAPGRHWLGLRLYGRDGSVEDWREQALEIGK